MVQNSKVFYAILKKKNERIKPHQKVKYFIKIYYVYFDCIYIIRIPKENVWIPGK